MGLVGPVVLLLADYQYTYWRGKWQQHKMYAALNKRTPAPDPPDFVERPAVSEALGRILTSDSGQYEVIVGNHGTGKSTLVERVANKTPGVIYVFVGGDGDVTFNVTSALIEALHWEEPPLTSWQKVFPSSKKISESDISAIGYH